MRTFKGHRSATTKYVRANVWYRRGTDKPVKDYCSIEGYGFIKCRSQGKKQYKQYKQYKQCAWFERRS
jgi:hypothetical protein